MNKDDIIINEVIESRKENREDKKELNRKIDKIIDKIDKIENRSIRNEEKIDGIWKIPTIIGSVLGILTIIISVSVALFGG